MVLYKQGVYSHINFEANRDVPLSWVTFLQEILRHGSCFLQKETLNIGPLFWLSPIFQFSHGENSKNGKICKWYQERGLYG